MASKRFLIEIQAFGKRLKQLRRASGMTQLDLEVKSGIGQNEISRIENGRRNIEFSTLVTLAEALEIPMHQFFKS